MHIVYTANYLFSQEPQEKTLNHRVLNASKPLKRTNYVLEEQTKPYNVYLNANNVPTYSGKPMKPKVNNFQRSIPLARG
jgi:hypothetical protein